MRPHLPRPAAPHRIPGPRAESQRSLAESWLGAEHPLVRSLLRSEIACQQLVTVTAAGAAGVIWFIGGWSFGLPLAIGAALAQAVFACRIAATSPATPLYGSETEPLRPELRQARYLMSHP